ncbi:uncharacterized protein N7483_008076 [Penicillium malachiteum]|uniref:uncharacterized protein n=1 Tax=Penicillium malachiteum TaxID=1324776 RepID=UPI002548CF05|nr:uncharacterized protein N7483_008076 [Penicillium malachiteum]KAJ5726719.1 hypothetical protein N7483_008076 [Penicillium malachiteum]
MTLKSAKIDEKSCGGYASPSEKWAASSFTCSCYLLGLEHDDPARQQAIATNIDLAITSLSRKKETIANPTPHVDSASSWALWCQRQ